MRSPARRPWHAVPGPLVVLLLLLACTGEPPTQPDGSGPGSVTGPAVTSDVTGPEVTNVTFTPASINTTAGSDVVTITLTVTDDLSGAVYAQANFRSQSGAGSQVRGCGVSFAATTSTTVSCQVTFPQYSEAGTWSLVDVGSTDAVGNSRYYTTAELQGAGIATDLSVTSVTDATGPQNTPSFSPAAINTTAGSDVVTLTFAVTDDLAGAVYAQANFRSQSGTGSQAQGCGVNFAASNSATVSCEVTFPQFSEPGTWSLVDVGATDAVGNSRYYTTAELQAAGVPTDLQVTSVTDVTGPQTTVSFTPSTVDISGGPGVVTITLSVTDDIAGAVYAQANFRSQSGTGSQAQGCGISFAATTSTTVSCQVTIPQFSQAGTWSLVDVGATDAVGNSRYYTTAELVGMGVPTDLLVLAAVQVAIDVKPGTFPNSLNPRKAGSIPVAILTTANFDAATVNPSTVRFGATGTEAAPAQWARKDVDKDGDVDLILHFSVQQTGLTCGATSARLTGSTTGGQSIQGSDSIQTTGC